MEIKATDSLDTAIAWLKAMISEDTDGSLHYRPEVRPRYTICVFDRLEQEPPDTPDPFELTPQETPKPRRDLILGADTHVAYVDGGCWPNPGGPGGAGIVMLADGKRQERSIHIPSPTTNNRAELIAVGEALLMIKDRPSARVAIGSDSEYTIGAIYRGNRGSANRRIINRVKALAMECGQFHMFHVRGHSGVEANERADRLASEGAANPDRRMALL